MHTHARTKRNERNEPNKNHTERAKCTKRTELVKRTKPRGAQSHNYIGPITIEAIAIQKRAERGARAARKRGSTAQRGAQAHSAQSRWQAHRRTVPHSAAHEQAAPRAALRCRGGGRGKRRRTLISEESSEARTYF